MNLNRFGNNVKEGTSLSTLQDAQCYFYTKNIYIQRYQFVIANKKNFRLKKTLKKSDYKYCSISGAELFIMSEIDGSPSVREKKHLIFIDSHGREHPTCMGLRKVIKDLEGGQSKENFTFSFETFYEVESAKILSRNRETDGTFELSLRSDFEKRVVPFYKKWNNLEICKVNLSDFLKESREVSHHLIFWPEDYRNAIMERIYIFIGVKI